MIRKLVIAVLVVLLGALAADYFSLFGTHAVELRDILHVRYKIVDKRSRTPVTGVHVTCVKRGSNSACTQKKDRGDGVVELNFVVERVVTRTLLFSRGETLRASGEGKLTLVFIHPDYERLFVPVEFEQLPGLARQDNLVELVRAKDP